MDAPTLALLGIAIVAAAKALDAVTAYLKSLIVKRRNGNGNGNDNGNGNSGSSRTRRSAELTELQNALRGVSSQIDDLHDWHNQRDDDGVLKWMNKSSTVKAIHQIREDIRVIKERQSRGCPIVKATKVPPA